MILVAPLPRNWLRYNLKEDRKNFIPILQVHGRQVLVVRSRFFSAALDKHNPATVEIGFLVYTSYIIDDISVKQPSPLGGQPG